MSQDRAVGQLKHRLQVPKNQELFQVDVDGPHVAGQFRQYEQIDPVLLNHPVGRYVSSANVGIDRYLSGMAPSRRNAYQVYRGSAAVLLDVCLCFVTQGYMHLLILEQAPRQTQSPGPHLPTVYNASRVE